jgi:zinc/manganese transport system substrate-binding protein
MLMNVRGSSHGPGKNITAPEARKRALAGMDYQQLVCITSACGYHLVRMKKFLIPLIALAASFTASLAATAAPLKVAALSTVLADLARNVGRDKVDVIDIVRPGIDPHEFEPSPGDVEQVASADVVLVSGKGLEGYLAKLEESAGGNRTRFINVGNAIGPSLELKTEDKTVEDPHWWHSVGYAAKAATVIRDAFAKADPADKETFVANTTAYLKKLADLDKEIRLQVAVLPRDQRKLVTSHDAFAYFARDFGFRIFPIEGVSTADEPSTRQVAELINAIKREQVKAVFFENTQNPKVIAEITKETGAKIGGELYADGLGAPGSGAATYIEMMHHNVDTIVHGLK